MRTDLATINFALYEDAIEYIGLVQVTLPNLSAITQAISGAGIGGNIEAIIVGHIDAMTTILNWRTPTNHSIRLSEPRMHYIDLRAPVQDEDNINGTLETREIKHVMTVLPKTETGGTIAPATPVNGSTEFAVRYWATYIDGIKYREIDPTNLIYYVDGVDYLASVRKAMGKQ